MLEKKLPLSKSMKIHCTKANATTANHLNLKNKEKKIYHLLQMGKLGFNCKADL